MKNILIVDDVHPVFMERVEKGGYRCEYRPDISYEQACALIGSFEGLVVRSKFRIDAGFLDQAAKLRFIARAGAGLDNIDAEEAARRGIELLNAPEGNRDAVGEHTLGMLLSLLNNLRKADQEVRAGIWDREGNRGLELKGKTVGIIGYGHMGQSFARKLSGFELRILAYDKYRKAYSDGYAGEASLEQLLEEADVLSLHIPLTKETRGMVNAGFWQACRKPVFILNTARGEIVDTQALLEALRSGKVRGAGLDVLEVEKVPALSSQPWFEELVSQGKVLLSPHVAGWSRESYIRISEVLAGKVLAR